MPSRAASTTGAQSAQLSAPRLKDANRLGVRPASQDLQEYLIEPFVLDSHTDPIASQRLHQSVPEGWTAAGKNLTSLAGVSVD